MGLSNDVTALLGHLSKGNPEAAPKLIPLVYGELRRMADAYMRTERTGHTLQAAALVHEGYLKLPGQHSVNWHNRDHFFGFAAQIMQRVLIDHARGHIRDKRGGGHKAVPLDETLVLSPERSKEFLELNGALEHLSETDARQAKIAELRFFGGLKVEENAEIFGISPKTVKHHWTVAKPWLHGELKASYGSAANEVGNS